ncbi:MAG: NAD(P)H-dependent oxidoreductase [Paludibacteraceae bacterium]|nr:NAD(P)H-dependent oxidoreductase [Paludibacteraceae bacterium]
MKRFLTLIITMLAIIGTASAKTLVVYYSYTGDCQSIADELTRHISADVVEIEPAEKGLKYDANGYALGTQLLNAINDNPNSAASYPAIDPVSVSVADYSTIIVVTPLWWSQMAAITQSFLFQVSEQMQGKQVGLIVSSASSGINRVVADFKRLVPNANYCSENLWINNSNRSNMATLIADWVEACGLNKAEENSTSINVIVGGQTFAATLANDATGQAFAELLPITLQMNELNGNEKYHYIGSSLPTNSYKPGTIHTGDIMLYEDNCVVLFYKTFSSNYSYTRIGSINNPNGFAAAVGSGNVQVRFETAQSTGISSPTIQAQTGTKILHNGNIYILRDGQTYTITGAKTDNIR